MGILTVPFNFVDLEDLDADYERNLEQATRVASVFQARASKATLGENFLWTGVDPYALYIQLIRFVGSDHDVDRARTLVRDFAVRCQKEVMSEAQESPGRTTAFHSPGAPALV